MLHCFYKWRHERKARMSAFILPKMKDGRPLENANLGSYLSHRTGHNRGFRPFHLAHRRRRHQQLSLIVLLTAFIVWVAYESIVALAFMVH